VEHSLDEVQTLPASLAVPTLAALSHLAHAYGSSVVFSTATQPAFTHLHEAVKLHCAQGWQPHKIVLEPVKLFTPMQRVNVTWNEPEQSLSWHSVADQLRCYPQALCIVNLKRHAKELWELLQEDEALHLSTNLCPAHRQEVLQTVRTKLKDSEPVRLIATQCIEAGVDVDFPVVYRAYAPLDAIIQAAGRCNREGHLPGLGQVHVFLPEDECYPKGGGYQQAAQVAMMLLRRHGADNMTLDDPGFITAYYRELYDISKPEAAKKVKELFDFVKAGAFPEIAQTYRLIEQDAINILVPYEPYFDQYQRLGELADKSGLTRDWIKQARPLTVSLYRPKPDDPLWDALLPVQQFRRGRRETQEDWFIYAVKKHYHPRLGLNPPGELNVWIA
jgi:CRISPR-associated endonuclease/helicase Cas3